MIIQLFINSCILITFISLYYFFVKSKDIYDEHYIISKIALGIGAGIVGILLMKFSVQVSTKIITDFRALPILLCSIFGGFIPSIIASILIGFYRLFYFGISKVSIIAVIVIMFMGIGFGTINLIKTSRKVKWIYCVTYLLIINTISMLLVIKDRSLFIKVFTLYLVSYLIMSYFIFEYTEYLNKFVHLFKKFKDEASIDYLTGLYNVRKFDRVFNNAAEQTIRNGQSLSLLFLDIDFFKKANDTYGHSGGDIILKNIALIMQNTCRGYDMISRNGGEEFSVLLLNCDAVNALEVAERIRKNVAEHKFNISNKVSINITVSIGISTYPHLTDNLDNLLDNADEALYEAKSKGRNKVVLYSQNGDVKEKNGLKGVV